MYHIAQVNIAHLKYPIDHPEISEFVNNLDLINSIAEQSRGFIWRLKEESDGLDVQFFDDPLTIVNMSVWERIEDLMSFAYKSQHTTIMNKRNHWFKKSDNAYLALWWISKGHIPTLVEAQEKLVHINKHGPSPVAFNFRSTFNPEGAGLSQ